MFTSGNWVNHFNMNGMPRNNASSWVIGDTGYLVAGYNSTNDSCLTDLWQFDPVKNTWTQKAYFPGAARQSGVAFAIGANGYYATGTNSKMQKNFQDCWQYNPSANSWTRMADLPDINVAGTGARYDAVAFAIGNYGYIGTGFNGTYLNDFWQFDPIANKWAALSSSPIIKRSGAVAFVYVNEAYICTGINNGAELKDFWRYNPSTDKWTQLRDIANTSADNYDDDYTDLVRDHAVALVEPNSSVWKAYLICGQNGSATAKTWEYSFTDDLWERKESYERAARQGAVSWSFLNLKRGFVGTGKTAASSVSDYDEWFPEDDVNVND